MSDYLESQIVAHPEQAALFQELQQLQQKKLWHQVTQQLQVASSSPFFLSDSNFLHLHQQFIQPIANKLNPLSFASFTVLAASQLPSTEESLAFLNAAESKVSDSAEAKLMLMMEITRYRLKQGEIEESKKKVEEGQQNLDRFSGVMDAQVYSIYYRTKAELAAAQQQHGDYYNAALLFLTYTPLANLPTAEKVQWALDIGLAALVGKKIYNFGELLQHQIFNSLAETPHQWLSAFLQTFNSGDIDQFHQLLVNAAQQQPIIAERIPFLQQKIRVMGLIDLVFQRPSNQRSFSFSEISKACQIELSQVEWLVMKALALKVIKGRIDEVKQEVRIGWVQARILNQQQINTLQQRLQQWAKQVDQAALYVQQNAEQIVTTLPA